ncbi:unnamed protein product [Didymodactylos carnosus]|uniref:Uncharacterized protein n=1 Tax=Didymodactylos carnosus TaxID=1234261 RepID=A0A813PDK9_9BILA|nr:unnamed protein product [Didymodactylos carnosus]CAF0793383.1 unnamed protein product [Didymodactylos carnosus]CAF3531616.1 unnamed protein product [Didymodactylos carnosus]CAF3576175.1 unnamed protein product [Didymodactylos carnosus]
MSKIIFTQLFLFLLIFIFFSSVLGGDEFEDYRCKCVCPSFTVVQDFAMNDTNRRIYVDVVPAENCTCKHVVFRTISAPADFQERFCPRCLCNYEVRNTTTMKDMREEYIPFVTIVIKRKVTHDHAFGVLTARSQRRETSTKLSHERNKTIEKNLILVVVIIIMVAISLLLIYMSFLLCLDPLMNQSRQPKHYERQINEAVDLDNPTQECVFSDPATNSFLTSSTQANLNASRHRSSTVLNLVTHEQSKWRKSLIRI